ncbi:hypothetical protein [Brevundimonas bacteroides]|uniref:hypothetical protein n=1 Tax=Brevundimonas bacteroides TaxID=74311 RepID=UPI000495C7E7|nr:hypothetical protein [Brevundimonas bacteroides]
MAFATILDGVPVELTPGVDYRDGDDNDHSWSSLSIMAAEDRAAIGVYTIVEPEVPPGQMIASSTLAVEGDEVVRVAAFVDLPRQPLRVTKADFQRRLTPAERYAVNALRRELNALTAADYQDPANALLLAAEDVLQAFDLPAEFIELNHPDTFAGLSLFAYLGVLTQARVIEIITP